MKIVRIVPIFQKIRSTILSIFLESVAKWNILETIEVIISDN